MSAPLTRHYIRFHHKCLPNVYDSNICTHYQPHTGGNINAPPQAHGHIDPCLVDTLDRTSTPAHILSPPPPPSRTSQRTSSPPSPAPSPTTSATRYKSRAC